MLSALKGVAIASSLAVSTAIAAMLATKTLHRPTGATALTAFIGTEKIHSLGFLHALVPVGTGVAILLLVAPVFNNVLKNLRYPKFCFERLQKEF